MPISVEFPQYPSGKADGTVAEGTAGLKTQLCGAQTTVSALMNAGKFVKKSIG